MSEVRIIPLNEILSSTNTVPTSKSIDIGLGKLYCGTVKIGNGRSPLFKGVKLANGEFAKEKFIDPELKSKNSGTSSFFIEIDAVSGGSISQSRSEDRIIIELQKKK